MSNSLKVKSIKPRLASRLVSYIKNIEENKTIGLLTKHQNRNLGNSKYHLVRSIDNISRLIFRLSISTRVIGSISPGDINDKNQR